jgi:cholesterol transport system auxiliary component
MTSFAPDRRFLLLALPSLAVAACGNIIGPPAASQIYFLRTTPDQAKPGTKVHWSLAIAKPDAPQSLDGVRIALARNSTEFDYYANAVWSDRLPELIQTRLLAGFEATGRIDVVERSEDMVHADYKLLTDIRDFEAHYTNLETPPLVAVTIVAHIVDVHSRKVVSSLTAAFTQACTVNSVNCAVEALDVALTKAVTLITDWALDLPAAAESPA